MALCKLKPDNIETINVIRTPPAYTPPASIDIAESREESRNAVNNDTANIKVFSDGSALEEGVGASAVLYREGAQGNYPKILKFRLGSPHHFTVANAEAVGTLLATHLIAREKRLSTISFNIDSQAVIKGIRIKKPRSGQHLIDEYLHQLDITQKRGTRVKMKIQWSSGHDGIEGNEKADEEAKKAAEGDTSPEEDLPKFLTKKPLPASISALRQRYNEKLIMRWKERWNSSPRKTRTERYEKKMPTCKFLEKTNSLTRRQTSLLVQLRTGHLPLNQYLYRINRSDTPLCPTCKQERESVTHFLLDCPTYKRERYLMRLAVGPNSRNFQFLLGEKKGMEETLQFIGRTGRLKPTFGEVNSQNFN
jgi:ribonuclease HI